MSSVPSISASDFSGGWSYTPAEMTALFSHMQFKPHFRVLEFGCGNSTVKLWNYLKQFCDVVEYDAYETDPAYAVSHPFITTHLYSADAIESVKLRTDVVYDLILVDGPTGHIRCKWYEKLHGHFHAGTILLADDFNHHGCFAAELDRNFTYTTLSQSDVPFRAYGEHSWKIVTNLRSL